MTLYIYFTLDQIPLDQLVIEAIVNSIIFVIIRLLGCISLIFVQFLEIAQFLGPIDEQGKVYDVDRLASMFWTARTFSCIQIPHLSSFVSTGFFFDYSV